MFLLPNKTTQELSHPLVAITGGSKDLLGEILSISHIKSMIFSLG